MPGDIALATKVFHRTEKLEALLESVDDSVVPTVYVADDGDTEDRRHLYDRDWPFELTVIDAEFDAGLGKCRKMLVDRITEEYLLIVDSDHLVPENVAVLRSVLAADDSIGGVSGLLLEDAIVTGLFHDIRFEDDLVVRDVDPATKTTEYLAGHPFVQFDFVPNAALFRSDCFEDYNWDPNYVIGREHLDFYLGHLETDWRFGVCPSVVFSHRPGGSANYESERTSGDKLGASKEYFARKWGIEGVVRYNLWLDYSSRNGRFGSLLNAHVSPRTKYRLRKAAETVSTAVERFR